MVPVVPIGARRPRRDGALRVGAVVPLDRDHRASLSRPLAALGWDRTTALVDEVEGHRVVVRAGAPTKRRPWLVPVKVTGALDVRAGDQIIVIALPGASEMRVAAAADALQELTGELVPDRVPEPVAQYEVESAKPRSQVRPAFGHG